MSRHIRDFLELNRAPRVPNGKNVAALLLQYLKIKLQLKSIAILSTRPRIVAAEVDFYVCRIANFSTRILNAVKYLADVLELV